MKALYKFKIEILLATLFSLSSCSLLDVDPDYVINPDTFYESETEVLYGLTGIYGIINSQEFYGNYYSQMLSNVDDLSYYARVQNSSATYWYNHTASDTYIYQVWTKLYSGINNANEFMEAIVKTDLDEDGKYFAEAQFLRAYYHFILAQAWGDVPLRSEAVESATNAEIAATAQVDVLLWCAEEMKSALEVFDQATVDVAPYRVTRSAIQGILARVYMFLAGESVDGVNDKIYMWEQAALYSKAVITSGLHRLNPDYSQVFINMIMDIYDTTYYESIWEADFMGNRDAGSWSNGRIGDVIGLVSSSSESNYTEWACNYAYGFYNGSLKLWDLYWQTDRTSAENADETLITDARQNWNLPEYNYSGYTGSDYGFDDYEKSTEKAPYAYSSQITFDYPAIAGGQRSCGKYRREVQYEGVMDSKTLWTSINYPILRYSDILLMYAEAVNEVSESYIMEAYNSVKEVRDRAGIETPDASEYSSQASMRTLIRNERGRELAFESLRKYDLIRWGTLVTSMKGLSSWVNDDRWVKNTTAEYAWATSSNVQEKHEVLPIPTIELGVNKLLKQNSMW